MWHVSRTRLFPPFTVEATLRTLNPNLPRTSCIFSAWGYLDKIIPGGHQKH